MSLMLVSDDGEFVRLQALGRVSGSGAPPEQDPMRLLVGTRGYARRVLLDMEQVEFIDSAGIGWLLACHKRFKQGGGILVLHSLPEQVQMTFKMLKLAPVFSIAADDESAALLATAKVR